MSNRDTIWQLFQLGSRSAVEQAVAAYEPDAEVWSSTSDQPLRGREEIRRFWLALLEQGVRVDTRVHEIAELDRPDLFLVSGRIAVRRLGEAATDSPAAWLFEFGEGGVRRVTAHPSRAAAVEAAAALPAIPR